MSNAAATALPLSNATRAVILNAADAVCEHNAPLGYAIREAVSGREVFHAGERKVECDRAVVAGLLRSAMAGASAHVGEMIRGALSALGAPRVAPKARARKTAPVVAYTASIRDAYGVREHAPMSYDRAVEFLSNGEDRVDAGEAYVVTLYGSDRKGRRTVLAMYRGRAAA